jgi:hypothetical protein
VELAAAGDARLPASSPPTTRVRVARRVRGNQDVVTTRSTSMVHRLAQAGLASNPDRIKPWLVAITTRQQYRRRRHGRRQLGRMTDLGALPEQPVGPPGGRPDSDRAAPPVLGWRSLLALPYEPAPIPPRSVRSGSSATVGGGSRQT